MDANSLSRCHERVFIGFGSNMGRRRMMLHRALRLLVAGGRTTVVRRSSLYRAEPVGYNNQPEFINAVAEVATELSPERALEEVKRIEAALGRVKGGPRWGPRPIDLDILLFGDRVVSTDTLIIPHAELHRRLFVLAPLAEIAPEVVHPALGRTMAELLRDLDDGQKVERCGNWTD